MPVEIKLGDVIRVYRSDKSEEEWYVSYLDSNEIQLINDTKELTLQIENGSFVDRTIKKMMVVYRDPREGYALQNDLIPDQWVNISFNDGVIFVGQITNLNDDQIEVIEHESQRKIYIDFAYKGIPKEFNISSIEIRDAPEINKPSNKEEAILAADKIVFTDVYTEASYIVEKNEKDRQYTIDTQCNDLMSDMLSVFNIEDGISKSSVIQIVQRYKQLWEQNTARDTNTGQISIIRHKVDLLYENLARVIWLRPTISGIKTLLNVRNDIDSGIDDTNIITFEDWFKEFENINDTWKKGNYPTNTNQFQQYTQNIFNQYTYIPTKQNCDVVLNDMDIVVNNGDFFSSAPVMESPNDITKVRYAIQRLNTPTYMIQSTYVGKKRVLKSISIDNSEYLCTNALIRLPVSHMLYYESIHPYASICDRAQMSEFGYPVSALDLKTDIMTTNHKNDDINQIIAFWSEESDTADLVRLAIPDPQTYIINTKPALTLYGILCKLRTLEIQRYNYSLYKWGITYLNKQVHSFIKLAQHRYHHPQHSEKKNSWIQDKSEIIKEYGISSAIPYTSAELLHRMSNTDGLSVMLCIISLKLKDLYVPNKIEEFEDMINIVSDVKKPKIKKRYKLVKRYFKQSDIEKDNEVEILYDYDLDDTPYHVIEQIKKDDTHENKVKEIMSILKKNGVENEYDIAETIIKGVRVVVDGEYAVLKVPTQEALIAGGNKDIYFKRVNNEWIEDSTVTLNDFDTNRHVECSKLKEFIQREECESIENAVENNKNKQLRKMIELEDNQYLLHKSREAYTDYMTKRLNLKRIRSIKITKNDHNDSLSITELSPFKGLRDQILAIDDIILRYKYIIDFYKQCCREPLPDESKYWHYCTRSGVKLLPSFMYELAVSIILTNNFETVLANICDCRGKEGDSGDVIVDRYSGYYICDMPSVDEYVFKVTQSTETPYVPDSQLYLSATDDDRRKIGYISNVISAMSMQMGIDDDEYFRHNCIMPVLNALKDDPILNYDNYLKYKSRKESKNESVELYDIISNRILIYYTLSYFTTYISVRVPSYTSKKIIKNCNKSFNGFPVGDDLSLINFVACIALLLKHKHIQPWNGIVRVTQEEIVDRIKQLITKKLKRQFSIQKLIRNKILKLKVETIDNGILSITKLLPIDTNISINLPLNVTNEFITHIKNNVNTLNVDLWNDIAILKSKIQMFSFFRQGVITQFITSKPLNKNDRRVNNSSNIRSELFLHTKTDPKLFFHKNILESIFNPPTNIYGLIREELLSPEYGIDEYQREMIYIYFINILNFKSIKPIPQRYYKFSKDKPRTVLKNKSKGQQIAILISEGFNFTLAMFHEAMQITAMQNIILAPMQINTIRMRIEFPLIATELVNYFVDSKGTPESFLAFLKGNLTTKSSELLSYVIQGQQLKKEEIALVKNFLQTAWIFNQDNVDNGVKNNLAEKAYRSQTFLKTIIRHMCGIYSSVFCNQNYKLPAHWELSKHHYSDILKIIKKDVYFMCNLSKMNCTDWKPIKELLDYIYIETKDPRKTDKIVSLSLHLIMISILFDAFKQFGSNAACEYVNGIVNTYTKMKKDNVLTYAELLILNTKQKADEEAEILRRSDILTDEERKLDKEKRKYNIGEWNVQLNKGIIKYDKDMYDLEKTKYKNLRIETDGVLYDLMDDVYEDESKENGYDMTQDEENFDEDESGQNWD